MLERLESKYGSYTMQMTADNFTCQILEHADSGITDGSFAC
jgi:hypothetical protein